MKRDKKRVEGEAWSDAQLLEYLTFRTYDGTDPDFHCLYRAYTRMNEDSFARFVQLFRDHGRNIHATNNEGENLLDLLRQHDQAEGYREALENS